MNSPEELKHIVRKKYAEVAETGNSCCDTVCCSDNSATMSENYSSLSGYFAEADLALGCGLPTQYALIKKGDIIVDLGSGAGNDCFIARNETGSEGKVIGIDMTIQMIERAQKNTEKLGYTNVEFRLGEIEDIPVRDNYADVVVSNCVLNLVPDKQKAYSEIFRILKPGGHFSISDIVQSGTLPPWLAETADAFAGCLSGAMDLNQYMEAIETTGFVNVKVQKERKLNLSAYTNGEASTDQSDGNLSSITVYAEKPKSSCCNKDTCCKS